MTASQLELLTGILSFAFTIALLSYLIGDNPLYRIALHLFIGASVGYAGLVVIYHVLRPRLIVPATEGEPASLLRVGVILLLFAFLVLKLGEKTAPLGNISTAYMVGVGIAVAMGGALTGTLIPQVAGVWQSDIGKGTALVNQIVIIAGTVTTLLYFQYWLMKRKETGTAKRSVVMRIIAGIGQFFIVVTLGTVYGGLIVSGVAVFGERIISAYDWIVALLG